MLLRVVDEISQVVVLDTLKSIILHMRHYANTSGHRGGRKVYYTLRCGYYCPLMAVECYVTVSFCAECACERIKLRKSLTHMILFPPKELLFSVSIDILGELILTKLIDRFLFVVTDRFTKNTKTILLKRITTTAVADAFVHH